MGIWSGISSSVNSGSQINQAQSNQQATAQQQMTSGASGSITLPLGSSNTVSGMGSVLTYTGGMPIWATQKPTIDPESIINMNGSEIKVKDLVSRLGELEEIVKSLKFTVELLRP